MDLNPPHLAMLERFLDLTTYRQNLITSNIANVDTPGYRTRDIDFRHEFQQAMNNMDASSHPVAREVGGLLERPDGNNVSIDRESLLLAENQIQFRVGVELIKKEFGMLSMAINEGKAGNGG